MKDLIDKILYWYWTIRLGTNWTDFWFGALIAFSCSFIVSFYSKFAIVVLLIIAAFLLIKNKK